MYDVITIGSASMDAFLKLDSSVLHKHKHDKEFIAFKYGSKVLIKDVDFHSGGGGTNTAVNFAKLGLRTGCITYVGKDFHGKELLSILKKAKVKFLGKQVDDCTNYSVILDLPKGDRTILVHKEASQNLEFTNKYKPKWFYLSAFTGKAISELEKFAKFAKTHGVRVAFNPSSYIASQGETYLHSLLTCTDILILNKEEAGLIVGKKPIKTLLKKLQGCCLTTVVITDGKNPVHAYDGMYHYIQPSPNVKVKEVTGAGDSFGSAFVAGMIRKNDIEYALKLGVAVSTSVIQKIGAKEGQLTKKEAEQAIKKMPATKKQRL